MGLFLPFPSFLLAADVSRLCSKVPFLGVLIVPRGQQEALASGVNGRTSLPGEVPIHREQVEQCVF